MIVNEEWRAQWDGSGSSENGDALKKGAHIYCGKEHFVWLGENNLEQSRQIVDMHNKQIKITNDELNRAFNNGFKSVDEPLSGQWLRPFWVRGNNMSKVKSVITKTSDMLLGMYLDPSISRDVKEGLHRHIAFLDEAAARLDV